MKKLLAIALGIIAALGGFVDIGDLVFNAQAGAKFGYSLLWALLVGTIGIVVYAEMSGRVAAVIKKPVFELIRSDYPAKLGFFTLVASTLANLLTCAAEVGGVALVLQLLVGYSYYLLIIVAMLSLIVIIWFFPFEGLERFFGYLGVGLVVFVVAAIKTLPSIATVRHGLLPHGLSGSDILTYGYFAVGIIGSALMPYEVYFYSSGGIEDKWKPRDAISTNRLNSVVGFGLGALVGAGILITAANVLLPQGIDPQYIGTTAVSVVGSTGKAGLLLALLGIMFAVGGAAVETAFASAFSLCQFAGWKWGKNKPPLTVPRFTWAWLLVLVLAVGVLFSGVDPLALTEYAVIFSLVVMPLTYYPILRTARSEAIMGKYKNGKLANVMGLAYLGVVTLVAVVAIPLIFITNRGQ